jgi:hypothetical protein
MERATRDERVGALSCFYEPSWSFGAGNSYVQYSFTLGPNDPIVNANQRAQAAGVIAAPRSAGILPAATLASSQHATREEPGPARCRRSGRLEAGAPRAPLCKYKVVVAINDDTIYAEAFLDVSNGPVIPNGMPATGANPSSPLQTTRPPSRARTGARR